VAAKPVEAGWEIINGDDVENSAVLEQHRFGMQMSLLGQGTPEGFVDHEFPAKAGSIDGLEGPPVRRGQEALMELLTAPERDEDEEDDAPPGAPRCPCGKRGRQGHVQLNGMVAKRPYFRCGNRNCSFLSFGELPSSAEAQGLPWMRLRTSLESGSRTSQSLVVVGRDGFRPEDVRLGQKSEALGDVLFLEALAVLTERPKVWDKLLPNSTTSSGCHEVRLCVAGLWRSYLIDERFPMLPTANSKNAHESVAFGRCAGNQLWVPLLQKAYAKAYAAYQFAFPAPLQVFLEELTGATVELVRLGTTSWSSRGCLFDEEELWLFLSSQVADGTLLACCARSLPPGSSSVFPILEIVGGGEQNEHHARLIRLRNPRIVGNSSGGMYEAALSILRGRPAEASTYADGSFWINYTDFLSHFSQLHVCHAAATGGSLKHTRTFEGDFTTASGLGTRGCTLRISCHSNCDLWISCMQPMPRGARLLEPCMGHVLNDLGIIILDANSQGPRAISFGGATPSLSCHISLLANQEILIFPVSFRAWSGAVRLRLQCSELLSVKPEGPPSGFWGKVWSLAADFGPELLGEHSQCLRRQVPVRGEDGTSVASTELLILRMEAAIFLILENPDATEAFIFDGTVEGNYVVTYTARGAQQGEWCDKNADSHALGRRSHWRRYHVEDIVPPASRQLVAMHFAVNLADWDLEVLFAKVTLAPRTLVGGRPKHHPFAPHGIQSSLNCGGYKGFGIPEMNEMNGHNFAGEDLEVQLALALSLQDLPTTESGTKEPARRWARRKQDRKQEASEALRACAICLEFVPSAVVLPCCGKVCTSCTKHWAVEQESQGLAADEISCPFCARCLAIDSLSAFLGQDALDRLQQRMLLRDQLRATPRDPGENHALPNRVLIRLGLKQCPGCGEGMQKESETCYKMICRTCRARFCFRCLSRLEYFNCGCSGAEHNFVDPLDGSIRSHQ